MLKIDIIAAGRLKSGPLYELCREYHSRIQWPLAILEVESKLRDAKAAQGEEHRKILGHITPQAYVIALDEKGKSLGSVEFSSKIAALQDAGRERLQFIIGGADGLGDEIRTRADLLLSFGRQTWPHMLARAMLLEQIYRAQQIIAKHPYHRE